MKNLLVLIVLAAAAAMVVAECNSQSDDNSSTDNSSAENSSNDYIETDEDGLYESARSPMDKAENVEDVLQDSADERQAAIDEATNGN